MKVMSEGPAISGMGGIRFRSLVMALCAALLAIGVIVSGASFYVSAAFKDSGARSETLMSSMRDHMTADMLHDSMRGIVFRAMYAGVKIGRAHV